LTEQVWGDGTALWRAERSELFGRELDTARARHSVSHQPLP
jgi:hypothetical protein